MTPTVSEKRAAEVLMPSGGDVVKDPSSSKGSLSQPKRKVKMNVSTGAGASTSQTRRSCSPKSPLSIDEAALMKSTERNMHKAIRKHEEEEKKRVTFREDEKKNEKKDEKEDKRELSSKNAEPAKPAEESDFDQKKFAQLNHLLNQTNLYSRFLSEQMQEIEIQVDRENQEMQKKLGKGKQKKGTGAPSASATAQETFLPLMKGGKLREYQLKGVKWMLSLWQNGLNGILADQMGLGKTLQAIGFLSHLWEKRIVGPYLVVAPLSTLSNWVGEFKKWCPDIPVLLYHGSADERMELRFKHMRRPGLPEFPVIVTSYEIAIKDAKPLQKYHYKYMVVDEGHRLKNFNCKLIRELRLYSTDNKVLLTGTPLQNNLSELWSLLNFLLPDVFASLEDFEKWFDFSNVGEDDATQQRHTMVVEKLHNILKPFLMRRLKAEVFLSLPMKKEIILYPTMSEHQKKINEQLLNKTLVDNLQKMAEENKSARSATKLRNILMQLRKNCNHPDLITGDYDGSLTLPDGPELVRQCGKMQLMDRLLEKLEKGKHKVLIFSQMKKMLDLLEVYLEDRGHKACRIDGGVCLADRADNIAKFNDPESELQYFLLSTRAGGLGINLASADTVIIYDSDWNPQQDLQAMDRCHRIGQTKPVLVLRLITSNSVEERMLQRAESKLKLERLVIKKGAFVQDDMDAKISFSVEEMKEILSHQVGSSTVKDCEISEEDLDRILDRSEMAKYRPITAEKGNGYEVLAHKTGAGLLSNVNA